MDPEYRTITWRVLRTLALDLADMEVLGLSVPDARRLIEALQYALDPPIAA